MIPGCKAQGVDPEDWFIERDGKQYPDDELLTDPEVNALVEKFYPGERALEPGEGRYILATGDDDDETIIEAREAVDEAEADALKEALRRRRHAKDACFRCPMRLECLRIALDGRIEHGTWGGYYAEERRQIHRLIDKRERREAAALLEE